MIYFIKPVGMDGPVKIGYTNENSAKHRLYAMQGGSPLILEIAAETPGHEKMEKRLHWHFRDYWSHGEWFFANKELTEIIGYFAKGGLDWGVYSDRNYLSVMQPDRDAIKEIDDNARRWYYSTRKRGPDGMAISNNALEHYRAQKETPRCGGVMSWMG